MEIKREEIYRLPWSKNDNPDGWIEITTYCNMACPGCYRGCDRKDNIQEHKPFEEIKKEIILLKKIRNCQTISISGGEPLMHPDILKIVNFIRRGGMNPFILTNGTLITKEKLIELKRAGLVGLLLRMDSLREKEEVPEEELNNLRKKYSEMVYSVKEIYFGLVYVVNNKNILQVPSFLEWCQKNNEKVDLITFITFRQTLFKKNDKVIRKGLVSLLDIFDVISEKVSLKPSAFLGSQAEDFRIKWLYSFSVSLDGKILGYTDNKFIELIQTLNHFFQGTYFFILKKKEHYFPLHRVLFFSILNKSMRSILKNYLKEIFKHPSKLLKKAHLQVISIVQPPGFVDGKRDFCDSCQGLTLYKGKFYPECGLEEFKNLGKPQELKDGFTI